MLHDEEKPAAGEKNLYITFSYQIPTQWRLPSVDKYCAKISIEEKRGTYRRNEIVCKSLD